MTVGESILAWCHNKHRVLDPGPNGRGPETRFEEYLYAWKNGWRWAWSSVRFKRGILCVLRDLYWAYIRGYIYEICGFCSRPVRVVWWADDDLWRRFSGDSGVCCPRCFAERAQQARALLVWVPMVWRDGDVDNADVVAAVWGER